MNAYFTKREITSGNFSFFCLFGRDGVTLEKSEGDWKTPLGIFPLLKVYYRKDRIPKPKTTLPCVAIEEDDGWCDDPNISEYNTHVKLPFSGGSEKLWREDELYDIFIEIGYNTDPAIPGKGSAIFIHCTRPHMEFTQGCLALSREDILVLLQEISPETLLDIRE